jgi:hypothetical protein
VVNPTVVERFNPLRRPRGFQQCRAPTWFTKYGKINVIIDTKDCKDTDHVDKIVVEHKITTHISLTLADEPGILKKGFGANFGVDISSS